MPPDTTLPVDLAVADDFELGNVRVRPRLREVEADGRTTMLEPRVMEVLVALAQCPGAAVTRDELMTRCWHGSIVGEDAVQRCIGRLRRLAATTGGFEIETLTRIGYRLHVTGPDDPDAPEPARHELREPSDPRPSILFGEARADPVRSGDRNFAERLADEITDALVLNRDLQVLARGTDPRAVRYIVNGALRRSGDLRRMTVQLNETATGRILWSHVAEIGTADTPAEELVIDFSARIATEIMRRETDRALLKSTELTAWEAVVRANAAYQRITLDGLEFALAEARRAVALDPGFAAAHAALANALGARYEVGGARDPALADESRVHCDAAVALDPDDATVLAWAANALGMVTRPAQGFELAERAVRLAPAHSIAHLYLGRHHLYRSEPEQALACFAEHERVCPRFPWPYYLAFNRALAQFMAGRPDRAQRELARSAVMNPDYPYTWIASAVLHTLVAQPDRAREAVQRLKALEGTDSFELQRSRILHSYPDPSAAGAIESALAQAWQLA